jgi:hypothetical protein
MCPTAQTISSEASRSENDFGEQSELQENDFGERSERPENNFGEQSELQENDFGERSDRARKMCSLRKISNWSVNVKNRD